MQRIRLVVLAIGVSLVGGWSPTEAQLGYAWTYNDLLQKADLAVIAECLATVDSGRVRPHPELTPAFPVSELETSFRILAVLKGPQDGGVGTRLRLRHYRATPDAARGGLVNSGSWLRLKPGAEYLMFLALRPEGVHEPLSGQTYPHASVYSLESADGRFPAGDDTVAGTDAGKGKPIGGSGRGPARAEKP